MLSTAAAAAPPGCEQKAVATRPRRLSLALNSGVALFVLGGSWCVMGGPSATPAGHWFKVLLVCAGANLAAAAWMAGAAIGGRWKLAIILLFLAASMTAGIDSALEFTADEEVLRPGRIEQGRFVHNGLGFSCPVFAGCRFNMRPFLRDGDGREGQRPARGRLAYDEIAVFFQMVPKSTESGQPAWSIEVLGAPVRFSSYSATVGAILSKQAACLARPGTRLLRPARVIRAGEFDLAEFEFFQNDEHIFSRHVFARSGSYLLHIEMNTTDDRVRPLFDAFVKSLRMTRHPAKFDD
jgi:hypothetical protein